MSNTFTAIGTVSKSYDRHKRTWVLTVTTESTSGLPQGTKTFKATHKNGKVIKTDGTRYKFYGYYWPDTEYISIDSFSDFDSLMSIKKNCLKYKHSLRTE